MDVRCLAQIKCLLQYLNEPQLDRHVGIGSVLSQPISTTYWAASARQRDEDVELAWKTETNLDILLCCSLYRHCQICSRFRWVGRDNDGVYLDGI